MSNINIENWTTNESRNISALTKNKSNAINNLPLLQTHNPSYLQSRDTPNLLEQVDSYEDICVYNGLEIRNSIRTEDIVDDTDPTVNLHDFFLQQLRESKDRMYLLQLEDQFVSLIQDTPHTLHYQNVTSYHRMLIHRMATYFGLHHTLDDEGTGVNVTKIAKSRLPETRFGDLIPAPQEGEISEKEPVVILRRKYHTDQLIRPNPQIIRPTSPPTSDSESKSIKQREETYAMVRARIFEGEGLDGEFDPNRLEDNLVQNELSTFIQNSDDPSKLQPPLSPVHVHTRTPSPTIDNSLRSKEETECIHSSNNNNKTHSNNNTRRRYENRHNRSKNSYPNQQPSHPGSNFSSHLFVPSVPYVQVGSYYTPQNESNMSVYAFSRQPPPPSTHSSLPATYPLHPNISLLPTHTSIPLNSQHFMPQTQHPDTTPYIPSPHISNPPPQSTLQLPTVNQSSTHNTSFSQYPTSFPMVGLQPANSSMLQRSGNPVYQPIQSASEVMNYPSYESSKEDAYMFMQNFPQMGSHGYSGIQWEPGVMKLKHQPNPQPSQQPIPHSIQQLASSLEMMGIQSGEEQMYLQSNAKHVPPTADMYPSYPPYPTPQLAPSTGVHGQAMYMQNNVALLPYQHYQNQDTSLSHPTMPLTNSRFVLTHPTSATASMPLSETGYPILTPTHPVRNIIANISPNGSLTNGQHQYITSGQMNTQLLQQNLLPNQVTVSSQNLQEFQMNSPSFKKHPKSTDLSFNHDNTRSKSNRSDKSRHRAHQSNQQMQHKPSGSIYIPPRTGLENHIPDTDGLLPTPAHMRILEIFELRVSFEEAERCIRGIAHVHVDFHFIKLPNSNQQVLLAIFESDQLTDILNKINSNPATKFKTRYPDQYLVKYLSSTILQQTASN
ncbi:CAMP-regulated phosphoprotein 21 isoform X4 [Oopsacas minuta]|uniref:cAMP-regulated phosphoprotein 21 isoform X4 n=1 Tax=Oopsacas minuta TaxID=111878 RepID=A0AAV7JT60_9METZ|nr:CAMP-regulated phosphoprotein 21 isoform X4 [Oopsacas minuta]